MVQNKHQHPAETINSTTIASGHKASTQPFHIFKASFIHIYTCQQHKKLCAHSAPWRWESGVAYKRRLPALHRAGALLPPGTPQQETQQIQHKHGGLSERAEEGFVVLLPLENVLWEEQEDAGWNRMREESLSGNSLYAELQVCQV